MSGVSTSGAAAVIGATRSRTTQFLKYRETARASRRPFGQPAPFPSSSYGGRGAEDDTGKLLGSAIDSAGDAGNGDGKYSSATAPAWVDLSDAINQEMNRIKTRMSDLNKAYSRAQLTTFDDDDDGSAVEVMTVEITRMFKRAERRVKQLEMMQGSDEDQKVRKNVVVKLASQLRSLSMDFRKMQKQYLAKLQAKESGGKAGFSGSSLDAFDEQVMGRGGDDGMLDGDDDDLEFTDGQLARMKESEAFSFEREKEIEEIVKSVNDLAAVMKDLSVLIIDQGTVLDRIDYNMTAIADSVEEGLKELEQAEKTQKRSRMFLCILMLFVLCIVMAVILVLKNMF